MICMKIVWIVKKTVSFKVNIPGSKNREAEFIWKIKIKRKTMFWILYIMSVGILLFYFKIFASYLKSISFSLAFFVRLITAVWFLFMWTNIKKLSAIYIVSYIVRSLKKRKTSAVVKQISSLNFNTILGIFRFSSKIIIIIIIKMQFLLHDLYLCENRRIFIRITNL